MEPITRKEILQETEKIVCVDRDKQYGSPENSFAKIAALWNAYIGETFCDEEDVAIMLALLKIARISTGQTKADNYIDLAGYAACAGEIATAGACKVEDWHEGQAVHNG